MIALRSVAVGKSIKKISSNRPFLKNSGGSCWILFAVATINGHINYEGVYKSTDGGLNWTVVLPIPSTSLSRVRMDPSNANVVWVITEGTQGYGYPGVYKSTDAGESWNYMDPQIVDQYEDIVPLSLAIDPNNGDIVYLGFPQAGVYKTTNGGTSWETANLPSGSIHFHALGNCSRNNPMVSKTTNRFAIMKA